MPQPLPPIAPWPPLDSAIEAAAQAAMADGSWGRYEGEHSERLLHALTGQWRREHGFLCSSGTIATELALRGVRAGGGEVIVAAYDFPGNFRAIEAVGAAPVIADVAPHGYTLGPEQLERARSSETQAVIISHLHGQMASMQAIMDWASQHGMVVVEDVCQSPGAYVDGRLAGSWGDVATFSFGGSKLLTAGRGGAVLTDDPSVLQRMKIYSERGNQAFPLSELQAAVLLPQLERLEQRNAVRIEAARKLCERLKADVEGVDFPAPQGAAFRIALRSNHRDRLVESLRQQGAPVGAGFRGFSRRRRRCRMAGATTFADHATASTLLLHHAALLSSSEYLDALARVIATAFRGEQDRL